MTDRTATLVCSAKGCAEPATRALRWNNPKIHTPERRKTWLACDAHEQTLQSFLAARGFWRETVAVDELGDPLEEGTGRSAADR